MASEQLGVINPEVMDEKQKFVLDAFLRSTSEKLLTPGKEYSVDIYDYNTSFNTVYTFSLKDMFIFERERKPGKIGKRHEVVRTTEIGNGSNGTIFLSAGTLAPRPSHHSFKPKRRVVKQIKELINAKNADAEFNHSNRAAHLHAKQPTTIAAQEPGKISTYTSFLTMKYFTGQNLHQVIIHESSENPRYTEDERIQLSIDILLALKKHVHDNGMIHRDLKPENIMITDKGKVKIIDYRDCAIIGENDHKPNSCGTIITMPPEQFSFAPLHAQKYSLKSDSYAIGKTLAELWHADATVNSLIHSSKIKIMDRYKFFRYASADTKFSYTNFYHGNLEPSQSDSIKHMIEQLTRSKPENRWSLDEAIDCLRQVQAERLVNRSMHSV